jgi:O-antigen ligase
MSERLDGVIAVGLAIAVVFTAVAHGAVEAWSVALFELLMIALLLLWAIQAVGSRRLTLVLPPPAWPLGALLALGLAQSVVFTGRSGRRWSLSLDVEATRRTALVLCCLLVAFLLAANFLATRGRINALQKFLVSYGLALAVFALLQYFTWDGRFYWLRPTSELTAPFGPFVSHSHFAGYLELLQPLPMALVITRGVRREARLFYGFAAALMGLAILASLSRGGYLSLAAELIFIAVAGTRLSRLGATTALGGAILVGILWIGPEPVLDRLTQGQVTSEEQQAETFFLSRGWIWRDTLALIREHPIAGVGLGAFETAYPSYSRSDGSLTVSQAHNDYLQILADGGLIGGALALWFIVSLLRLVARGLQSRDPLRAGLALGSGAGICGMLVHSFFDFNLQLPAHALLFLLLSAVASHLGATVTTPVVETFGELESELRLHSVRSAADS